MWPDIQVHQRRYRRALLDGVSNVAAAYSVRRLRTAYTGNCLKLRRASDSATSDFAFDGNGDLDTSAISTWIGGSSATVDTWYDQSGNGINLTAASSTEQPDYVASGDINSGPVLDWDGTHEMSASDNAALSSSSGHTVLTVLDFDSTTGLRNIIRHRPNGAHGSDAGFGIEYNDSNYNNTFYEDDSGNTMSFGSGGSVSAPSTGTDVIVSVVYEDSRIDAYHTGSLAGSRTTAFTGSLPLGTVDGNSNLAIGYNYDGGDRNYDGSMAEMIIITERLGTTAHNDLGENIADYYGLTWTTIT